MQAAKRIRIKRNKIEPEDEAATEVVQVPEKNKFYINTSIREVIPFILLIGSWVWFFSAQSSEIKLNSRLLSELTVVVSKIGDTLTEQRIKASTTDEALKRIDASLLEIKSTIHNQSSVK